MASKMKPLLIIVLLALIAAACGAAPGNNYPDYADDNTASEPGEDEPAIMPTSTMMPMPTMTISSTLPNTGGGESPVQTPITISMDLNTVYREVVASLPQGSALFNPPEQMRLGETKAVEVRVVPVTEEEIEQDEQLQATLTADFDSEQEVLIIPLRVSTVMRARLSGEAFTIVPLMVEEQIQSPDDDTLRWIWEVRPEKSGEQRLTLTLTVVVNAEGMGDKNHVTTEVRQVQVSGNPVYSASRFMTSNWEWVVTGLLFPAVGWGWNKFRKKGNVG